MAAGVKSITRTACFCSISLFLICAAAEVASNTMLTSLNSGSLTKPSTPSAVIAAPIRLARANPSEFGSIPTMATHLSDLLLRMILIMRSVPILPEPIMATPTGACLSAVFSTAWLFPFSPVLISSVFISSGFIPSVLISSVLISSVLLSSLLIFLSIIFLSYRMWSSRLVFG